jgi:tetratricopeptide (TPR) repeat protein
MSTAAKLKKRAIELEQKKQFDKALSLYIQFLQESDGSLDDTDVPLYNRVGDLLLRTGNASDALNYYEKAVDLYADRGFLNNAIALCNKVLRQAPGRASIYYKLGRISATKGFKSDAKKNFLEYADRMQKAGQIDEAFRALKEFADLCPDQDDIRLMLAEQLSKENRQGEALEQLQKLHDKLDSEGRMAEARATADRMKSIDPEAVPRVSGSYRPQKSNDLIFLDTSFEDASRPRQSPPPRGRQVSDPDLVVLTMGDTPDTPLPPAHNAAVADAFSIDIDTPADDTAADDEAAPAAPGELPLLDVSDVLEAPPAIAAADDLLIDDGAATPGDVALAAHAESVADETASFEIPSDAEVGAFDLAATDLPAIDVGAQADPPAVDLAEQPSYVSGPPLGIDYAADLATTPSLDDVGATSDLFDFRSPPRTDDDVMGPSDPGVALDPDVAFPSLDLDDISLPSADDVTSGAGLTAALAGLSLGDAADIDAEAALLHPPAAEDHSTDEITFQADAAALIEEAVAASEGDAADAADEADLDWMLTSDAGEASAAPEPTIDVAALAPDEDSEASGEDDSLDITPPSGIAAAADTDATAVSIADPDAATAEEETIAEFAVHAPQPSGEQATVESVTTAPRAPVDEWQARRERAERLLESGDRASGIHELEQMAADLERGGDLERATTIVDELIRLSPDSIRNHQKRVELAFRVGDRRKLIDAYIELGDALFRSGEERKAVAVYQRVLELAPDDPRVRAALDSVRTASPPAGSGTVPSSGAPAAPPPARATALTREHAPRPASPPSHGASLNGNGLNGPSPARKPSPLDRSAANSDFVDLGDWLRASEAPKSTRMVAEEKPPTGDEQADFQEMLKRFKEGVADNVDDEDYESHYDLGVAYKEMGLMDEAVAEFQKALRGTHHRVRAYEALGQCFVEKEQYQVASSVLSRAIALGEGDDHHLVGVLYLMGRAAEALARPGDALDYYQRVFAVDIEFRDVTDRISAIERKAT